MKLYKKYLHDPALLTLKMCSMITLNLLNWDLYSGKRKAALVGILAD